MNLPYFSILQLQRNGIGMQPFDCDGERFFNPTDNDSHPRDFVSFCDKLNSVVLIQLILDSLNSFLNVNVLLLVVEHGFDAFDHYKTQKGFKNQLLMPSKTTRFS